MLTVGDTKALDDYPNGGIGQICQLALKNDPKLPVVRPRNFDYMRRQVLADRREDGDHGDDLAGAAVRPAGLPAPTAAGGALCRVRRASRT